MIVRLEGMKLENHAAGARLVLYTSRVPDPGENCDTVGRVTHEYGLKLDTQAHFALATLLWAVEPGTEINIDIR